MKVIAGVDLGGTAINYTIIDAQDRFLIEGLCEHPALSTQGPDVCLAQIEDGLAIAAGKAGVPLEDIAAVKMTAMTRPMKPIGKYFVTKERKM